MADQAVGFSFQADVVNAASLAHLLTGRVLKAMSDGGVDFYAVVASIWLGKQVPIQSSLESSIHQQIAARQQQYTGFLAKALSIGWGHSQIPCEMSRTKAGTSALVLIGALTTGSSYLMAAHVMSELLSLSGFEQDKIPNVDVLRVLASYLSPFVQDLGFPKVFQHITTTCIHRLTQAGSDVPPALSATGDAPVLAGIIRQLCMTSQSQGSIHMVPRQRTAWSAAFASHVLGMSVEVRNGANTLWACGGVNGTVVLQLDQGYIESNSARSLVGLNFVLVNAPKSRGSNIPLFVDYAPGEALAAELGSLNISGQALLSIQTAIARKCFALSKQMVIGTSIYMPECETAQFATRKLGGHFSSSDPLRQTLLAFNIPDIVISLAEIRQPQVSAQCSDDFATHGLPFLDQDAFLSICGKCPGPARLQETIAIKGRHRCSIVGRIINAFASSIVALAQCSCNLTDLRLRADVLNASMSTLWTTATGRIASPTKKSDRLDDTPTANAILEHIGQLLFSIDMTRHKTLYGVEEVRPTTLGLSGGAHTVYYTALQDGAAFDDNGRVLTIASGRASVGEVLKNSIIEHYTLSDRAYRPELKLVPPELMELSPGSIIQPQYYPGKLHIFMQATLLENDILIESSVGSRPQDAQYIELNHCIDLFLFRAVVPECDHNIEEPWKVPKSHFSYPRYHLSPFSPVSRRKDSNQDVIIYALKGDRLQQVVQFQLFRERPVVLQLKCCLRCAFASANSGEEIVMGG
ncbi:hypothetical protein HJFPF1_13230 [Paramyrothecium foliicola]|nr:hypothetical protein HJFPF1_13230 [Paramyrothecium foliicola]